MSREREEIIKSALDRMQIICSKSEKCSGEIVEKLKSYSLNENEISGILESLKRDKFIDDRRYSTFFCRDKFRFNHWGKIKIRQSLKIKKVDSDIIEEGLSLIDDDAYYELILELVREKNRKITDSNIYSRKGKIFRFLGSKGFESDLIYKAIAEVLNDE
ncbi:MAG: RecX family transcriptional regulator [Bacteroidales bacterium]|nr:RecX family transcriptional regulator [Bacteroidales bacterium]MCF8389106.1 RecX family transcriptional regulator [Bacteroidales bacterium]